MSTRVFGYGSLIYKMDVPFIKKEVVCIKGWSRYFYQGSTDHRGTIDSPGRVCTLLEEPTAHCWGVVFTLDPNYTDSLAKLDFRERNGYKVEKLNVYANENDSKPIYEEVLTYIARPDNEVYLGIAPIQKMASHIISCQGMSGKNSCYVLKLASAVRELMPHVQDDHLFSLESAILNLLK
eukprot:NODE_250_length_12902_cov_0.423182.p4 type:complete len:180 gc:universal NODE_250_length_12902_cov_0.423182:3069-2530(-)